MRRFGEPRDPRRTYTPRPGVYAILPRNGKLLVTHQVEPKPEIQLPGGGIDPGESAIHALHREVLEESGWRIAYPRRFGVYRRFTFMPEYDLWAEKIAHIYVAFPTLRFGPPSESGHTELWLEPDVALSALASDGDRKMLDRFLIQRLGSF